jgi:Xaa-Pro aminopeptidase
MTDRRPERLAALRRGMESKSLDALLVSSLPNIRYLTGFSGSNALLVVTHDDVVFLSDSRYGVQARDEVGDAARVQIESLGLWEPAFRALETTGKAGKAATTGKAGKAGYESEHLTAREAGRFKPRDSGWTFEPTVELVETLRIVKSPEEIEAIRDAGEVATEALAVAIRDVRVGQSEFEIAALLEGALRRAGSEWFAFPTIVASGPRSALPHAGTSDRTVNRGDLLLLDFGAIVDGYCSDITRTFLVGAAPTPEQAAIYSLVQAAQRAALDGLKAGLTGKEGDALARGVIEAAGHGDDFGHSLGHGLGLEVHEAPRLAKTVEKALEEGAVVTVEPGVYLEGWGGVRIEDDVVLRAGHAELLTEFDRELVRLG